jgi:chemotaxis signal transduction protein
MSWVRGLRHLNELDSHKEKVLRNSIGSLLIENYICPVMNLNEQLKSSVHIQTRPQKVLIFRIDNRYFGILVDSVENKFQVAENHIFQIPEIVGGSAFNYFDEVIGCDEQLILSLSPKAIYSTFNIENKEKLHNKAVIKSYNELVKISIANHRQKKIVIFTTNSETNVFYGLSITQIPQILQLSSILSVPGSENHIIGIIEWRGLILPVIDIALSVEKQRTKIENDGRILVVRLARSAIYVAIVIQPHVLIQNFPITQDLFYLDVDSKIDSVHRQFKYRKKVLVIPNIDNMVSTGMITVS